MSASNRWWRDYDAECEADVTTTVLLDEFDADDGVWECTLVSWLPSLDPIEESLAAWANRIVSNIAVRVAIE